jgi:hypothetical protein
MTQVRWATCVLAIAVSGACGGEDSGGKTCAVGSEGCDCFPNDTCNDGLTCASDLCVLLDGSPPTEPSGASRDEGGAGGTGGADTADAGGVAGDGAESGGTVIDACTTACDRMVPLGCDDGPATEEECRQYCSAPPFVQFCPDAYATYLLCAAPQSRSHWECTPVSTFDVQSGDVQTTFLDVAMYTGVECETERRAWSQCEIEGVTSAVKAAGSSGSGSLSTGEVCVDDEDCRLVGSFCRDSGSGTTRCFKTCAADLDCGAEGACVVPPGVPPSEGVCVRPCATWADCPPRIDCVVLAPESEPAFCDVFSEGAGANADPEVTTATGKFCNAVWGSDGQPISVTVTLGTGSDAVVFVANSGECAPVAGSACQEIPPLPVVPMSVNEDGMPLGTREITNVRMGDEIVLVARIDSSTGDLMMDVSWLDDGTCSEFDLDQSSSGGTAGAGGGGPGGAGGSGGTGTGGLPLGGSTSGEEQVGGAAAEGGAARGGSPAPESEACRGQCGSAEVCLGGDCCVPPEAGGDCNIPDCGCQMGEVCCPVSAESGLRCMPSLGQVEGEECAVAGACSAGLGCFGGRCKRYCASDADCGVPTFGPGSCLQTTWAESAEAIPGVKVCENVCDPVMPQDPSVPLLACPEGFRCAGAETGVSYCAPGGEGFAGDACESGAECAPGHYCSVGGTCQRYCFLDEGCSGGSCSPFLEPAYAGLREVGYCS